MQTAQRRACLGEGRVESKPASLKTGQELTGAGEVPRMHNVRYLFSGSGKDLPTLYTLDASLASS